MNENQPLALGGKAITQDLTNVPRSSYRPKRQAGIAREWFLVSICIVVILISDMDWSAFSVPLNGKTQICMPHLGENISVDNSSIEIEAATPVQQYLVKFIDVESPQRGDDHEFSLVRPEHGNTWAIQRRQREGEVWRERERQKIYARVINNVMSGGFPVINNIWVKFKSLWTSFILRYDGSIGNGNIGAQLSFGRLPGIASDFFGRTPEQVRIDRQKTSNDHYCIINASPKEISEERKQARQLIIMLIFVGGICAYFGHRMLSRNKDNLAGRVMLGIGFFCFFLLLGARNLV